MLRLFLSLILAVSFFGSFSAKAETELWGDYSGVTLRVKLIGGGQYEGLYNDCLLYTSPSPRDGLLSRMPSSA